jgi:hypothetical protein
VGRAPEFLLTGLLVTLPDSRKCKGMIRNAVPVNEKSSPQRASIHFLVHLPRTLAICKVSLAKVIQQPVLSAWCHLYLRWLRYPSVKTA